MGPEQLVSIVRAVDDADAWNIDGVDRIECLPRVRQVQYADLVAKEHRVIVTPVDSPMPSGRLHGYQTHVNNVHNNFMAIMSDLDVLNTFVRCQF